MPTTPIYNLRYPLPTDPADVPVDLQELALDVEGNLRAPVVTSLPVAPFDGQEIMFACPAASTLADGSATNGASPEGLWHLRYRASTAGSYKWHFLGGRTLWASYVAGVNVTPAGAWVAYLPTLRVPLAGVYRARVWAKFNIPTTYAAIAAVSPAGVPTQDYSSQNSWAALDWIVQGEGKDPLTVPNLTQKVFFAVAVGAAGIRIDLPRLTLTPELVG